MSPIFTPKGMSHVVSRFRLSIIGTTFSEPPAPPHVAVAFEWTSVLLPIPMA